MPTMRKDSKTAYICSVAWTHEVGETEVELGHTPASVEHSGCGVMKVRLTPIRMVKRENMDAPGATIPAGRMRHEQLKSVRQQIRWLKAFEKRIMNEPIRPWVKRKGK